MRGILPALMTGYDTDGEIDTAATCALVDRLLTAGVHGLFVGGTSGEGVAQSAEERKHLLTTTLGHIATEVPVIAHVGTLATRSTIDLAQYAEKAGAAAVAAVTPFYFALDDAALAHHYREISASVQVPVHLYHIPALTGRTLDPQWVLDLAHQGWIAGMKYSAADLDFLEQVATHAPSGFAIYNGSDEVLVEGLLRGATGGVGSSYNVMPELYVAIADAVADGRIDDARTAQATANAVLQRMETHDFLAFLREVLHLRGIDIGASRRPLPSLTDTDRSNLQTWFHTDPAAAVLRESPDRAAARRNRTRRRPGE